MVARAARRLWARRIRLGLARFKRGLDNGIFRDWRDIKRDWIAAKRDLYPWAGERSRNAAECALRDVGAALAAWLDPKRPKARFPRCRRRSGKAAFRADNGPDMVGVDGEQVWPPKIRIIRMREAPRFEGCIRECAIKRGGGRWFACFAVRCEDGRAEPLPDRDAVGVEVGVKVLATLSDGTPYRNPPRFGGALRKRRRCDKAIVRNRKANPNLRPRRRERLRHPMRCIRDDARHEAATDIVRRAGRRCGVGPARRRNDEERQALPGAGGRRDGRAAAQDRIPVGLARRAVPGSRPMAAELANMLRVRSGP